jgi:pyruvate/2-oxoglutarate dehydrogenase complex dihydrolipoamide dehydrogenase (E3) component
MANRATSAPSSAPADASLAEAALSDHVRLSPLDEHNLQLLGNVHPPAWQNPQPAPRYNLVVIGAGTAGLVAAAGAAGLGAKVALVERGLLGGDCLNVGCVPSKALIRAARASAQVRDAGGYGVRVPPGAAVDFPAVMERMRRLRTAISPHDSAARFRDLGVDVFFGQARFTGPGTIEVSDEDAGRIGNPSYVAVLRFSKAVITTGARAATPTVPGLVEAGYLTNETVFSLTELPRRLAVVGAGPIGCELAQACARFGSEVYLIEALHGVLPNEDRDAADIVKQSLRRDGVRLLCCGKDLRASRAADGKRLSVDSHGQRYDVTVDEVLVAVGRAPNVEGLGLENAGVTCDKTGVLVNDRLQTSNPRVFAAGDICSRYKFTHAADAMARIVVQNALLGGIPFLGGAKASALTIPWCTYTDPEVAHVGLYEQEAQRRGIAVQAFIQPLHDVDRAVLDGESQGFVRVLVTRGTDRIVGATIVASHAGEMISEITLAMTGGLGLKKIASTIHPYPTQAESIKKLGDQFNRTRLTPRLKRLLERWLAWTR